MIESQLNIFGGEERCQTWSYMIEDVASECAQVPEFCKDKTVFNRAVCYILLAKCPSFMAWIEKVVKDGRDYARVPSYAIAQAAPRQLIELATSNDVPSFETVVRALRKIRSSQEPDYHHDPHYGKIAKTL